MGWHGGRVPSYETPAFCRLPPPTHYPIVHVYGAGLPRPAVVAQLLRSYATHRVALDGPVSLSTARHSHFLSAYHCCTNDTADQHHGLLSIDQRVSHAADASNRGRRRPTVPDGPQSPDAHTGAKLGYTVRRACAARMMGSARRLSSFAHTTNNGAVRAPYSS
jgi:hypothetical protein